MQKVFPGVFLQWKPRKNGTIESVFFCVYECYMFCMRVLTSAIRCILHVGGRNLERQWLHKQVASFAVSVEGKKKPKIQYRLPLVGNCCRAAWILSAGFPNPKNKRVLGIEALVRKHQMTPLPLSTKRRIPFATGENFCRAFLTEYIWLHSQQSPSTSDL